MLARPDREALLRLRGPEYPQRRQEEHRRQTGVPQSERMPRAYDGGHGTADRAGTMRMHVRRPSAK
ncbi:MAG: hypothetical protein EDS66_05635 [Planctomycetota bacterium]|nr:MAG: hypothetical protein EDS66_05635 [Planctomycetota bacterium]MCQ3921321.1 hypothetical protein [Planctomycetota bacterium]